MPLLFQHICGYRSGLFVVWSYIRLQRERVVQRYITLIPIAINFIIIAFCSSLPFIGSCIARLVFPCIVYIIVAYFGLIGKHIHTDTSHITHTKHWISLFTHASFLFSFTVLLLSSFFSSSPFTPFLRFFAQCISFVLRDV